MSLYPTLTDRDRSTAGRGPAGPVGPARSANAFTRCDLAEAATAAYWIAGIGRGCHWRGEGQREGAQESDDLNDATDRHSVGPPRPHRRFIWTRSAQLCG